MKHVLVALAFLTGTILAANELGTALVGSVKKVDSVAKTITIETEKGASHTIYLTKKVAVHGGEDIGKVSVDAFKKIKEGDRVAIHYTAVRGKEIGHEIDVLGEKGLKASKGTISEIDRGGKHLTIETADGAKETYHLTDRAAVDTGKELDKSAKVTVYYAEDAGKKIAHFFE